MVQFHQKKNMKVELQFRTIAMDFWASLEHKVKYKKDVANPDYIAEELRKCAESIAQLDFRMQEIERATNPSTICDVNNSADTETQTGQF